MLFRSLDPFFLSADGQLRHLRVETYGGASWLTQFSVLAGVSSNAFGKMSSFVQPFMSGRLGDAVPQVLASNPIACEGLDLGIIGGLRERGLKLDDIALLPEGNAWLMTEFGADTREEAVARARVLQERLGGNLIEDKVLMNRIWTIRETGASATSLKDRKSTRLNSSHT